MAILYKKDNDGTGTTDVKTSTSKIASKMPSYNEANPINELPGVTGRSNNVNTIPSNLDTDRIRTYRDYTRDYYINKMAQQHFAGERKKELDEYYSYMNANKGKGTSTDELANAIEVAEKYATDPTNIKFYIPEEKFKDYLTPDELKQFNEYYYDTNNDPTSGGNVKSRAIGARALASAMGNRGVYDNIGMSELWANKVGDDTAYIGSFNKGSVRGKEDRPFTYADTQYMPRSVTDQYKIDYFRDKAIAFDQKTGSEELKTKFNTSWDKSGNRINPQFKRGGILFKPK